MIQELIRHGANHSEIKILRDIAQALDQSAIVAITDRTGKIIYANEMFTKISQYSMEELLGANHRLINSGYHLPGFFQEMWATISRGKMWRGEIYNKAKDGSFYWVDTTIVPFLNDKGNPYEYISIRYDITPRKESERMTHELIYYDQLTNLPNRISIRKMLHEEIARSTDAGKNLAFVFLNIDRFRYVNDSFGHEAGDYVLTVIAKRLKDKLQGKHMIGRLSGDEFALLLKNIRNAEHAEQITQEVKQYLEEPIELMGQSHIPSVSFGIALCPEHATKPSELVMKAEKALGSAKSHGGSGFEMYRHGTATKTLERILLENELRKSVQLGHFNLDYQPKLNLSTGELTGVEALVRWNHPDLGRIPPDRFIPVAEETKIILPLGEWVLREACRQAKKWQDSGYQPFRTAVNMSAVQLEEPTILKTIQAILGETGVAADLIEIELTESAFADRKGMRETVGKIRDLGITVSIDDFGTGYSTFSYIQELPADILKIDMSFIREIHENEDSRAIVEAIVTLADIVGLKVIAEGVEYGEQVAILNELGCREGQGYYYSKPVSPKDCETFMKK
ncbi:putative bifunctional diguanylate cyclase/phosphodiesterase [Sporosarcina sp. YIM B06819]|uniref:putative bifunctional diguanylate cyclase/phosphodiesterase n=1 Tax=Sporosarcina sp. YIM B06819 TaxID=3081769 RepID=UPI00298D4C24|nr:EAL domain-containing protein [Sporosarcina sp. YIM B06819]